MRQQKPIKLADITSVIARLWVSLLGVAFGKRISINKRRCSVCGGFRFSIGWVWVSGGLGWRVRLHGVLVAGFFHTPAVFGSVSAGFGYSVRGKARIEKYVK